MAEPAQLDHVPFGATDLSTAGATFARLGFALSDVGVCRWNLGGRDASARSLCIVLERGYLDLIELDARAWREHLASSPVYASGFAPTGMVLSCASPDTERARLAAAGVPAFSAYDIERTLAAASPAPLGYRISSLDRAGTCLPLSFLRDDVPQAMRRPDWLAHSNTAMSIARLELCVPDLEEALREADLVLPGARRGDAALDLGGSVATLVEEPRDAWSAAIFDALGRPKRTSLLALEFAVSDIARTERALADGSVRFERQRERLLVDPSEGLGCGIAFAPVW